jgi:hypothetical protein
MTKQGYASFARLAGWIVFGCLAFVLSGCAENPNSIVMPPRPAIQSQTELDFVRRTFNYVQPRSIQEDREYCGYIMISPSGRYLASAPTQGRIGSCTTKFPDADNFTVLASYHTHGAWSDRYDGEIPSFQDMATDLRERVNGYIATPGGRLWYVDAAQKTAWQVCGRNCLVADPAYKPDQYYPIRPSYTLRALSNR